jgi:hypothetical protein
MHALPLRIRSCSYCLKRFLFSCLARFLAARWKHGSSPFGLSVGSGRKSSVFNDFSEVSRSGDILFTSETVVLQDQVPVPRYILPSNGIVYLLEEGNQKAARITSRVLAIDDARIDERRGFGWHIGSYPAFAA